MEEQPLSVNCRGSAHVTPGVEDVTTMCLNFRNNRSAIIHSSWLDSEEDREMTIVGSKRMIVYDDVAAIEKIKIYDARVERPPHYDTFGEFHYAYHYGDMYVPTSNRKKPLRSECQHFLDCIREGISPLTDGRRGLELVRILEASSQSLKQGGGQVICTHDTQNGVKVAAVEIRIRAVARRPARRHRAGMTPLDLTGKPPRNNRRGCHNRRMAAPG